MSPHLESCLHTNPCRCPQEQMKKSRLLEDEISLWCCQFGRVLQTAFRFVSFRNYWADLACKQKSLSVSSCEMQPFFSVTLVEGASSDRVRGWPCATWTYFSKTPDCSLLQPALPKFCNPKAVWYQKTGSQEGHVAFPFSSTCNEGKVLGKIGRWSDLQNLVSFLTRTQKRKYLHGVTRVVRILFFKDKLCPLPCPFWSCG